MVIVFRDELHSLHISVPSGRWLGNPDSRGLESWWINQFSSLGAFGRQFLFLCGPPSTNRTHCTGVLAVGTVTRVKWPVSVLQVPAAFCCRRAGRQARHRSEAEQPAFDPIVSKSGRRRRLGRPRPTGREGGPRVQRGSHSLVRMARSLFIKPPFLPHAAGLYGKMFRAHSHYRHYHCVWSCRALASTLTQQNQMEQLHEL